MGEVELVKALTEHGGVIGILVAVMVVSVSLYLKYGSVTSEPAKPVNSKPIEVKVVDDPIEDIDRRLSRVEAVIEHLPTRDEFYAVDRRTAEMRVKMEAIEETTARTGRSVTRIEDFLLSLGARNE